VDRRGGGAVIGTLVAAPDGTAWILRKVRGAVRWAWRKIHVFLARYLPFLRRSSTVHGVAASAVARSGVTGTATVTPGWDPDASPEAMIQRLHEQEVWVYAEFERARQEAREGDAELRQIIEQQTGKLRAAHQAHQAVHEVTQRQAARVDARGVILIGLGVVMTGVPDGLATLAWLRWLVITAALAVTVWFIWWVISDMRKAG
jgi:hypothetical protein